MSNECVVSLQATTDLLTPLIIPTSSVSDYFNLANTCLFHVQCFPHVLFLCLGAELRLLLPKPSFRGIGVLRIFQSILNLIAPPAGEKGSKAIANQQHPGNLPRGDLQEWGARARDRKVLATLHGDPQASLSILTCLLASRKTSSTLNSTTLCREADVPLRMIPSDLVPEMDKLKTSLASKIHPTSPSLRRETWEWLRGCKELNWKLPEESGNDHGRVSVSPHMQKTDIPFRLFPVRLSLYSHLLHLLLISSIFALDGGSQAGLFIQRGYCLRS